MDRTKINEVLDRYVDMEVKASGSWRGDYPFWSFIRSARNAAFGEYVEDKSLSFEENRAKEYSFLQDPDKMQEIRATLKAFLHEKDLSGIFTFTDSKYNISLLRDIKEYLSVEEFSLIMGVMMRKMSEDLCPAYISKEELLAWLKSCDLQKLMNEGEYRDYLSMLPSQCDIDVYRGTDSADDELTPSNCFIWTTEPYHITDAEREGEFFTGCSEYAGYAAKINREDIFSFFLEPDSMVVLNPEKLHDIREVDFWDEFPQQHDDE